MDASLKDYNALLGILNANSIQTNKTVSTKSISGGFSLLHIRCNSDVPNISAIIGSPLISTLRRDNDYQYYTCDFNSKVYNIAINTRSVAKKQLTPDRLNLSGKVLNITDITSVVINELLSSNLPLDVRDAAIDLIDIGCCDLFCLLDTQTQNTLLVDYGEVLCALDYLTRYDGSVVYFPANSNNGEYDFECIYPNNTRDYISVKAQGGQGGTLANLINGSTSYTSGYNMFRPLVEYQNNNYKSIHNTTWRSKWKPAVFEVADELANQGVQLYVDIRNYLQVSTLTDLSAIESMLLQYNNRDIFCDFLEPLYREGAKVYNKTSGLFGYVRCLTPRLQDNNVSLVTSRDLDLYNFYDSAYSTDGRIIEFIRKMLQDFIIAELNQQPQAIRALNELASKTICINIEFNNDAISFNEVKNQYIFKGGTNQLKATNSPSFGIL